MKSIILAGGTGTRLYPISTPECPKQFIPLFISETQSLFQLTVERCQRYSADKDIYVVANWAHHELVEAQLGTSSIHVLYEDSALNTLPALALGLQAVVEDSAESGHCIVGIFPADHMLGIEADKTIRQAYDIATEREIIILGVKPSNPSTEYGYICPGVTIGPGIHKVQAFIEKPALAIAKSYCGRGFLWNSGIIIAHVDTLIAACSKHAPQITKRILHASTGTTVKEMYDGVHPLSIDYGLLEYLRTVLVIELDAAWTDCGSISSLRQVLIIR